MRQDNEIGVKLCEQQLCQTTSRRGGDIPASEQERLIGRMADLHVVGAALHGQQGRRAGDISDGNRRHFPSVRAGVEVGRQRAGLERRRRDDDAQVRPRLLHLRNGVRKPVCKPALCWTSCPTPGLRSR